MTISGLVKSFGPKRAVDEVDMHIEPGTFVVLLGPSGSGKSTLLRCLAGIEAPSAGTITLGAEVVDAPGVHVPPERRNLAMVFQDYALWPHLTAEKNVAFALQRRRLDAEHRRSLARTMLDQVGLSGLHDRYPGQLSGGEQQRVALARALVAEPGLLLFDEPLSNLDADRRERLRVDIGAMVRRHGATALYITHDQAEAFALADQVGVLDRGRLLQFDTPEAIYERPTSAFVARFTGLSGELSGTVEGLELDGTIRVATPAGTVRGAPIGVGHAVVGRGAQVLVRPSAVRLADVEASRRPVSIVAGVVCDSAFRGWGYEHVVEVAGGFRLSAVPALRRLGLGQRVQVEIREAGCLVVCEPASTQVPLSDEAQVPLSDDQVPLSDDQVPLSDEDQVPITARFDHERLAEEASSGSAEVVGGCGARVKVATARGSAGEDPTSGSCATDVTVTNGRGGARRFVRRSSVRGR